MYICGEFYDGLDSEINNVLFANENEFSLHINGLFYSNGDPIYSEKNVCAYYNNCECEGQWYSYSNDIVMMLSLVRGKMIIILMNAMTEFNHVNMCSNCGSFGYCF